MARDIFYLLLLMTVLFLQACAPVAKPAGPDLVDRLLAMRSPAPRWTDPNPAYVPPDDALLDDLLDFWVAERIDHGNQARTPTPAVRRRLLAACAQRPNEIDPLLYCLPETPQACDAIHAAAAGLRDDDAESVRDWLMTRSKYGRDILLAIAKGDESPTPTRVDQSEALAALAALDWSTAEPLLRKYATGENKLIAAVALDLEYHHEMTAGDKALMAALRERLENIADDRAGELDARRRACAALLAIDWDGRNAWIISLLDDPQLAGQLNLKNSILWQDTQNLDVFVEPLKHEADPFVPILARFAADANPGTRRAGIIRLVQYPRADALRPVLGLLNDEPTDQRDGPREKLLTALATVEVPESIPYLSKLADKSQGDELTAAALALVCQHAPNALDAVKKVLDSLDAPPQHTLFDNPVSDVGALTKIAVDGGLLSDGQIVKSIEAYAEAQIDDNTGVGNGSLFGGDLFGQAKPWPHDACIGAVLIETPSPRPQIARQLLDCWACLRTTKPQLAVAIWKIVITWPDEAIDHRLACLMCEEPLNESLVTAAVARAATLRERDGICLRHLTDCGCDRAALAAAVLDDPAIIQSMLDGPDIEAKRMLFAVARLARTPLPVPTAGRLMAASDARLSHAAERYLSCEDSPEARRLLWARHPGEELVLGSVWGGFPEDPDPSDGPDNAERPLRQEMREPNGPDDIYAMWYSGMGYYEGCAIIRTRGNSATMELQPSGTTGKLLTRDLSPAERRQLLDFLARTAFDDLPQLETDMIDGPMTGYLHLNRVGGRRIFMHGEGDYQTAGSPHYRLKQLFARLADAGTYETHYPKLQEMYPGLQILFSNRKLPLNAIWKRGDDLLVSQSETFAHAWHPYHDGKLGEPVETPAGFVPTEYDESDMPDNFIFEQPQRDSRWRAVAGDSTIIWNEPFSSNPFLYRWRKPNPPVRIGTVPLSNPVTTYDGKWLMATNDKALVGIELAGEKMHAYTLPAGRTYEAQAYVPVLDKVLVAGSKEVGDKTDTQYWLVDPAVDKAEPVKGEFEPLLHTVGRMIPSTTNANEVWLTTWDDSLKVAHLIRYNLKTWTGTEMLTLPDMRVTNDRVAIDEKGGAAYIVIFGDLLRVPLGSAK